MGNAEVSLHPSERIDDLLTNDLKIIQSDEVFSFSLDAVLLGRFCYTPPRGRIMDLCTGNGVIPLLLCQFVRRQINSINNGTLAEFHVQTFDAVDQ